MSIFYVKALHIVGVISWMAAMLYIVRLYIYHTEAKANETEHSFEVLNKYFVTMERRLWRGIATPAMLLTAIAGLWLMLKTESFRMPWFHVKALLLFGLFAYHGICSRIRKDLSQGKFRKTSRYLRAFNEVGTLLMVAIVFPAVTKDPASSGWAILGFLILATLIVGIQKALRSF